MKVQIYRILYKFLLSVSNKWECRKINQFKWMVGSTLLVTNAACGTKESNSSDTPPIDIEEIKYTPSELNDDILCYVIVETMPEYPGGQNALINFLRKNISCSTNKNYEGRVVVQFIIDHTGDAIKPTIIRSLHPEADSIALSLISKMPKWKPGMMKGIPVKVKYTVPVVFKSQNPQLPETPDTRG
ncbi:MAG: energy transducer TonB [Bacteroides sp.]|nr:energy transducer TonB [Bacteroides sp.]